jgi:hypothetical protein
MGYVELALLAEHRRQDLGEPASSRQHLDDAHVLAHAEERQDFDRQAIDVAGALFGRADRTLHRSLHALLKGCWRGLLGLQSGTEREGGDGCQADDSGNTHMATSVRGRHCTTMPFHT